MNEELDRLYPYWKTLVKNYRYDERSFKAGVLFAYHNSAGFHAFCRSIAEMENRAGETQEESEKRQLRNAIDSISQKDQERSK